MRPLSASLAIAALSLLPAVASAAPATTPSMPSGNGLVLPVQGFQQREGWWEQSGRPDDARQRYWQLGPRERYRYNQLEAQIRDLQAREEQLRREQQRILRWGD